MKINHKIVKKIPLLLLIGIFIIFDISYASAAQKSVCLRPALGKSFSRIQDVIRLKGGAFSAAESVDFSKKFDKVAKRLINAGEAWTIFDDRKSQDKREKDIRKYQSNSAFFNALRKSAGDMPLGFDVVMLKTENLPMDAMLHPGHSRNQAYIAFSTISTLESIYNNLQDEYKPDLIRTILEGFKHEAAHILLRSTLKNKSPPEIERTVDDNAPSFRARELFRLVYLARKLEDPELMPDMNKFFENLKSSKNKASHLFAYTELSLEKHMEIAEKLISSAKRIPARIDIILAQHHIGYVLANSLRKPEDADSPLFKQAVNFLIKKKLIDKGPETNSPYPAWKFVRELIIQNKIALLKDITRSNIILSDINQLDPWISGTQTDIGDSVKYPKPGETMALPVSLDRAKEIINAIPEKALNHSDKQNIIGSLKGAKDAKGKERIIITYETLSALGERLLYKAVTSTSAAGAGTRFALVVGFDESGKPLFHDKAKAVLKLSLVDEGRSFIEMFLAQAGYINNNRALINDKIPCIIYTSHITDPDVKKELERIGYKQADSKPSRYTLYKHSYDSHYSDVTVVRLHKTNLLDLHNGDFFANIDGSLEWSDAYWPHGHDSAIIDLIASGLAYEMVQQGKSYVDISNVDNRAAGTDSVILAIMELTSAPLLNETSLKPKGERGGGAPVKLKTPLFKTHARGNLERPNMEPSFEKNLTKEQTAMFLPYKNTANYCINIVEYVKQAFLKQGASDSDVMDFLKEFYDVRDNEEKKAELKFKKLEALYRINSEFMFIETSKRYPAVQVGNLLGSHSWLVDALFLEVPQGQEADKYTRFEENKENIENLGRIVGYLKKLSAEKAEDDGFSCLEPEGMSIEQALEYLDTKNDYNGKAELKYAIKSIGAKEGGKTKVLDLLKTAEYLYQVQFDTLTRIQNKGGRYYPKEDSHSLHIAAETQTSL
jgi:hypothetical protein